MKCNKKTKRIKQWAVHNSSSPLQGFQTTSTSHVSVTPNTRVEGLAYLQALALGLERGPLECSSCRNNTLTKLI